MDRTVRYYLGISFPMMLRPALTWVSFKKKLKANKNLLKSISFAKASCCISNKSLDFNYFWSFIVYSYYLFLAINIFLAIVLIM